MYMGYMTAIFGGTIEEKFPPPQLMDTMLTWVDELLHIWQAIIHKHMYSLAI